MSNPIHTHSLDTIPLDDPPFAQDYILVGPKPEAMKAARDRWVTAGQAKGGKAVVYYEPGAKFARFRLIAPPGHKAHKYVPTGKRRGAPDSQMHIALAELPVGGQIDIAINGRHPHTIRNNVSRSAKRLQRNFKTQLQPDRQTYRVTRTD